MDQVLKPNNQKLFKIFLISSIAFHLALLISKAPGIFLTDALDNKANEQIVRIKFLNNFKSKISQQIVQTENKMNNKIKPLDKAFLGKRNNKVDRQTKSASIGKFKSAGIGDKKGSKTRENIKKATSKSKAIKNLKFSDLAMQPSGFTTTKKAVKRTVQIAKGLKNGSKKSRGLGQTNDFIEDIPLGDFTKLNTQEFEFYGFYDRIRKKLEIFWGTNIQAQAEKMMKKGRSIASDTNHITSLEIFLNNKGEIVDVSVNSPSGVRELDNAAIRTFNQAGPFPNPPKGMLKQGKAKIKWSFVVNT